MTDIASKIPVARPALGDAEVAAAARAIRSGWVTQGPEVAAFEREFAAFAGAPHACAVSSGTTALHLALLAVGVQPGDDVITVSHSFIATANAIRYCGARPVFIDIDPGTLNMDPSRIERAIGPRTRAILAVHQVGLPCDLAAIGAIANAHRLALVEDAACAVGSEVRMNGRWERIGKPHSDVACFSFHPRKLVTTGDGGMITTANAALDAQARALRHHGMSVSDLARHSSTRVVAESYDSLGFNYRMTDVQAAIGRVQLAGFPERLERRRRQAARYQELLAAIDGLRLPVVPEYARPNWQTFCVQLPAAIDQTAVMQTLLDAGIATRRGVMCAHREPAYPRGAWSCGADRACDHTPAPCPHLIHSERAQDHGLALPMFDGLSDADQVRVADALKRACSGEAVRP
jgi:perosamine synthetase